MNVKIKSIPALKELVGKSVPTYMHGHSGRTVERLVEELLNVDVNRGHGPDIPKYQLEIKARDLDATSPQTVADMSYEEIVSTPYRKSHVYEKFQQQIRVYTQNNVIVSADIYDFGKPQIQDIIESAYNNAQEQLIENSYLTCTSCKGGYYGYFEQCAGRTTYSFRLSNTNMKELENMSTSTFNKVFDYQ